MCAGKGEEYNKLIRENRECVTIDPFVSLLRTVEIYHLIFKGSRITRYGIIYFQITLL